MVRDRPDGGLVARYRFVFGRFRTRLRGFLFRGFSGTFLVAPSQDAIYVKRRPRLAKLRFGPAFELAASTRRRPLDDTRKCPYTSN
jgi:hypothetical protein